MDDNKIFITDEDGKEYEMNILFTFEANDKQYVVAYENGKEDDLFSFIYDEEGSLFYVEDPDELSMVQEVIDSFNWDDDDEEDA